MFSSPQVEHHWLDTLVGEWTSESECRIGPDQPPMKSEGRMSIQSFGGLWIIAEGEATGPDGGLSKSLMTIGYDPQQGRYVGTFIATMMANLWVYSGAVDASGKKLVLDTEGPRFDQTGLGKYQDIVEIVSADHWILSSQILNDDGVWQPFMAAHQHRVK